MATKNETARTRTEAIKVALRSTTTCSDATVAALQELLLRKTDEPVQKENVRAKAPATARRRAGTATAADGGKQPADTLAPRDKYILATEAANISLKTLTDALKNQTSTPTSRTPSNPKPAPSDAARPAARPRTGNAKTPSATQKALKERSVTQATNSSTKPAALRRSSSYSSFLTPGPDIGLVATAECARIAFAYLGTAEAAKVLGKDSKELQLENGILALVGKLVALGLDNLAIKEMRNLKRRLDKHLGHDTGKHEPQVTKSKMESLQSAATDKEGLASLLSFGDIDVQSPALPLIASLQTYTLRVIARLRRPRIIEATWEYLQLENPSSPANLLQHLANSPSGAPKAARQLESLAQTILALCPSIASASDAATLQPSPAVVLRLQLLAFKIRNKWWALSNHKGNSEQELLEPFAKCVVTFARRSDLPAAEKYNLSESLYKDLADQLGVVVPSKSTTSGSASLISKALSSLAQAADLSDEALLWLGSSNTEASNSSAAKQACRTVRVATVSIEASLKSQDKPEIDDAVTAALEALKGSVGGSALELDSLFMEANALRRISTKWLATIISASTDDASDLSSRDRAISAIAASTHFSARFVGTGSTADTDPKSQHRHEDRLAMVWKCLKSIMESAMTCCKHTLGSSSHWTDLDAILQDCSHILLRLEEENAQSTIPKTQETELIQTCIVKLSNAYWTVHLQSRKKESEAELTLAAMQRSIQLVQKRSPFEREAAHFTMKLERTGDVLESLGRASASREVLEQCIQSNADAGVFQTIAENAAKSPLQTSFEGEAPTAALGRVLKSLHRSYIKHGVKNKDELAFYDDTELQSGVRGALLEWQLGLYSKTMSRNRQWDANLNESITAMVQRLSEIYAPQTHPIRRMRLYAMVLQLNQSYPHIVSSDTLPQDMSTSDKLNIKGSEDEGLSRYEQHFKALCDLKISLQQTALPTQTLRQCFTAWESIIDSVTSWDLLIDCLDDVDTWVQDAQASVDCLNAKGEEYLALPVLHLLVKVFELKKGSDASELILNLCLLGVQFLRLGYTGKAGLALAKAEALLERKSTSIDAKLRWHVAYAEYLLRIGNATKW
jgi:separase